MKIHIKLFLAVTVALTTNCYATITCSKPKLSHSGGNDSIYHFKAVETCNLVNETIKVTALKDLYKAEVLDPKSQFQVHTQKNYDDKNGMHGYSLDVTQAYDTKHGFASVRATVLLLDDSANKFFMELRSKYVLGEGEESYNKTILNQTTLQVFPDHAELTLVKEIDVEEPWYAPDSTFFNAVENDLSESIQQAAMQNAQKISGQKVDALRK